MNSANLSKFGPGYSTLASNKMDQFRRDLDHMSLEDLAALRLYAEVEINGSQGSTTPV